MLYTVRKGLIITQSDSDISNSHNIKIILLLIIINLHELHADKYCIVWRNVSTDSGGDNGGGEGGEENAIKTRNTYTAADLYTKQKIDEKLV